MSPTGEKSPYTFRTYSDYAWYVRLDGDADSGFNGSNGYVDVSYG